MVVMSHDGSPVIAVELRLWEAIDRAYLAPFQYFGVTDTEF